jgi:hypothetical protein
MKQILKRDPGHPWNGLAGEVMPGDDKKLMPLQAADLLAGQIRRSLIHNSLPVVLNLWKSQGKHTFQYDVSERDLNNFAGRMNLIAITQRLEKAKASGPVG